MSKYQITRVTQYGGTPGTDDPGYCTVHAQANGREFLFVCDPDGSRVRSIATRPSPDKRFRAYSTTDAAKRWPGLQTAINEHLASAAPVYEPW